MKDKETGAKEDEKKLDNFFSHFINDNEAGGSSRWLVSPTTVKLSLLSFISSQRVADLEAVEGIVEKLKKDKSYFPVYRADYNEAISDLLAKLEEFKGKIR